MDHNIKKVQQLVNFKRDGNFATFEQLQAVTDKIDELLVAISSQKISLDGIDTVTIKGEPGKDADETKIISIVLDKVEKILPTLIPDAIPGKPGTPGKNATIDYEKVVKMVLSKIELPKPFDMVSLQKQIDEKMSTMHTHTQTSPSDIARSLENLSGKDRLDYNSLKNIPGVRTYSEGKMRGGGDTVVAGSGVIITTGINGNKTIAINEIATTTTTSTSSLTPSITARRNYIEITALNANLTINNPTGSAQLGDGLMIAITPTASAWTLTFGSAYVAKAGVALPTAMTASKTTTMLFVYNAGLAKWNLLASGTEA